jgi:glycosyltransferase involved in cell wall biosynthesis
MTHAPSAIGDVTIVVTCYRQARWLPESVASARSQTIGCRVVVVDDGSDDGSADVAEYLGVETMRLPHRGALETFRSAVGLVETAFYVLLNADDVLDDRYVERTRERAADPDIGFVYTGVEYIGSQTGTTSVPGFDLNTLKWGNYIHAASLTRTAAYQSVQGFDPRFAGHHEDWALWVAMARKGWRGIAVDLPLLKYRRHAEASRNPVAMRDIERARWRLFRRHPGLYGLTGLSRLVASSAKLALLGR